MQSNELVTPPLRACTAIRELELSIMQSFKLKCMLLVRGLYLKVLPGTSLTVFRRCGGKWFQQWLVFSWYTQSESLPKLFKCLIKIKYK